MTANLKRFNPSGSDGTAVTTSNAPVLSFVINDGDGTAVYRDAAGANRGADVGVEVDGTGTAKSASYIDTSQATAGTVQVYYQWRELPASGGPSFLGLRSTDGTVISLFCDSTGSIGVTDETGAGIHSMNITVTTGVWYRFDLSVKPGTTTTGQASVEIHDDNDNLLDSWSTSAGNFGTTTNVYRAMTGMLTDVATNAYWTQLAIDTAASAPTIAPVAKNAAASSPVTSVTAGDYTNEGGASSLVVALSDDDDATFAQSPADPDGAQMSAGFGAIAVNGQPAFTVRHKASAASPAISRKYEILQGSTVVHTEPPLTLPLVWTAYTIRLTAAEADALTVSSGAWYNLRVRVTDTAA